MMSAPNHSFTVCTRGCVGDEWPPARCAVLPTGRPVATMEWSEAETELTFETDHPEGAGMLGRGRRPLTSAGEDAMQVIAVSAEMLED